MDLVGAHRQRVGGGAQEKGETVEGKTTKKKKYVLITFSDSFYSSKTFVPHVKSVVRLGLIYYCLVTCFA